MPKLEPTPEILESILSRVPEGFIRHDTLCQRVKMNGHDSQTLPANSKIVRDGDWWYDTTRLSVEQFIEVRKWARPTFPDMNSKGIFTDTPIEERLKARESLLQSLSDSASGLHMLATLRAREGYSTVDALCESESDRATLADLISLKLLKQFDDLVFDPLLLSVRTVKHTASRQKKAALQQQIIAYLESREGQTATQSELIEKFGSEVTSLFPSDRLSLFQIKGSSSRTSVAWIRLSTSDPEKAREIATASIQSNWEKLLTMCGHKVRQGVSDGTTARMQVLARTYTLSSASQYIGIHRGALERAIQEDRITAFEDPDGKLRLPAEAVEAASDNPEYAEHLAAYETVTAHEIALVTGVKYDTLRRRLQRERMSRNEPQWREIRGRWGLPDTYQEFRNLLKTSAEDWRAVRDAERREQQHQQEEARRAESKRREQLREKLVAAFPSWRHDARAEQRILLHIGPPNSGKTHAALDALIEAGNGWYLAPLRLLAFEAFDRLNQQGVPCNLLTGEEHMPVAGATITAATVEMFNPKNSGRCVIIDEAQMLADADRGWAWTRALMEAESPDIHVIGPATVRQLVEQMASAAAIPLEIIDHDRLAPIQIAERSWPLDQLPSRTILVAFSRQIVLQLKTELEKMRRNVSVVYGNLPPEVRRKQADRFAAGETDICVATDAVGMGLNLPADYVCFYEVEKYDGRSLRPLTPAEVQQIGGRAGRYGLSTIGEVGATTKRDLKVIRRLFYEPAQPFIRARVAPTVEDLELIPGSLAEKLRQWAQLESIPDSLKEAIQTADMSERVELASMLTDREVKLLGMSAALKLVNAPTRQNTRAYWHQCARSILTDKPLPFPPVAPKQITNTYELDSAEFSISCADIYLWLSQRREFSSFAPYEQDVRDLRTTWSVQIDEALLRKINTMRRCNQCGRPLSLKHRFPICDSCFYGFASGDDEFDDRG